nr:hypothetical protein Cbor_233 [Cedratvirus borely]
MHNLHLLVLLLLFCSVQAHDEGLSDTTCLPVRSSLSRLQEYNQAKSLLLGNFTCLAQRTSFTEQDISVSARRYLLQTYYDKRKGAIVSEAEGTYMEEYVSSSGEVCVIERHELAGFYSESFDLHRGGLGYASRILQSYDKHVERLVRRVEYALPTLYGQVIISTLFDKKQRPVLQETTVCTRQ